MKTGIRTAVLLALTICHQLHAQAQNTEGIPTQTEAKSLSAQASYRGQVSEVTSGNTLTLMLENKKLSIRLLGVMAAAKGQFFSKEARENLVRTLSNKTIEVVAADQSAQGKLESPILGKVLLEGRDVGLEQIRGGFAVLSKEDAKYQTEEDQQLYEKAARAAKDQRTGMWSDKYRCKGDAARQRNSVSPAPQTEDTQKGKVTGSVQVQVTIDESGKVISAKALCGHPLLREASVNAAYGARFTQTFVSGVPVRVTGIITYNFVAE